MTNLPIHLARSFALNGGLSLKATDGSVFDPSDDEGRGVLVSIGLGRHFRLLFLLGMVGVLARPK